MKGIDLSASNVRKTLWRRNNLSSAILIRTDLTDAEGWKGGDGDLYDALFWGTTLPDGNVVEGPERHP